MSVLGHDYPGQALHGVTITGLRKRVQQPYPAAVLIQQWHPIVTGKGQGMGFSCIVEMHQLLLNYFFHNTLIAYWTTVAQFHWKESTLYINPKTGCHSLTAEGREAV